MILKLQQRPLVYAMLVSQLGLLLSVVSLPAQSILGAEACLTYISPHYRCSVKIANVL